MIASAKMGMDFVACAPEKYFPNEELVAQCRGVCKGKRSDDHPSLRMLQKEQRAQM